jgi:hypothetical protein
MKTLGQIAQEAYDDCAVHWNETFDVHSPRAWAAAAQAVRAAVIDDLAREIKGMDCAHGCAIGHEVADRIRSLK